MYNCDLEKFRQNPALRKALLDTGDAKLIESSPYDSYWGEGKDKKGLNHLGTILERVRNKIKEETPDNFDFSVPSNGKKRSFKDTVTT
jgi:ribA/ribD-fused uncharacterized protein